MISTRPCILIKATFLKQLALEVWVSILSDIDYNNYLYKNKAQKLIYNYKFCKSFQTEVQIKKRNIEKGVHLRHMKKLSFVEILTIFVSHLAPTIPVIVALIL